MTRRLKSIEDLHKEGTRRLLMAALVVGDPFVGATRSYMDAVVEGGADIIELVLPFSDPTYHGPVMRRVSARTMSENVRWEDLAEMVADFRTQVDDVPVVVTSYYNRVLARGEVACAQLLGQAGVDALMVVDLPIEEAGPLEQALEEQGLALLRSLAPSTPLSRFEKLAQGARGFFIWTGHSGTDVAIDLVRFSELMVQFNAASPLPIIASMGVESGEEALEIARFCQGVLVGSALAWLIEGRGAQVEERLRAFVADLRIHLDT